MTCKYPDICAAVRGRHIVRHRERGGRCAAWFDRNVQYTPTGTSPWV